MSDPVNWTCNPCKISVYGRCQPTLGGQYESKSDCLAACGKCRKSQIIWILIFIAISIVVLALGYGIIYGVSYLAERSYKKSNEKRREQLRANKKSNEANNSAPEGDSYIDRPLPSTPSN